MGDKKKEVTSEELALVEKEAKAIASYEGLTERQIKIQKLSLRGATENAIAKILGVSRATVAKEKAKIREVNRGRLETLDKEDMMADTLSLFEEIERSAWGVFQESEGAAKNRSLQLILDARERSLKLMMEVGIIERAATKTENSVILGAASPFLDNWDVQGRRNLAQKAIEAQWEELDAPQPPQEEEDDIEDAEIMDDGEGVN